MNSRSSEWREFWNIHSGYSRTEITNPISKWSPRLYFRPQALDLDPGTTQDHRCKWPRIWWVYDHGTLQGQGPSDWFHGYTHAKGPSKWPRDRGPNDWIHGYTQAMVPYKWPRARGPSDWFHGYTHAKGLSKRPRAYHPDHPGPQVQMTAHLMSIWPWHAPGPGVPVTGSRTITQAKDPSKWPRARGPSDWFHAYTQAKGPSKWPDGRALVTGSVAIPRPWSLVNDLGPGTPVTGSMAIPRPRALINGPGPVAPVTGSRAIPRPWALVNAPVPGPQWLVPWLYPGYGP